MRLQRVLHRVGHREIGRSDAAEQTLRAGAVEMRRLVPTQGQVLVAILRKVETVALRVDADILAPAVEVEATVVGAGGEIEPVQKQSLRNIAVFLKLGAAVGLGRKQEISAWTLSKSTGGTLNEPSCPRFDFAIGVPALLGGRRFQNRAYVSRPCTGCQSCHDCRGPSQQNCGSSLKDLTSNFHHQPPNPITKS